MKQKRVCLSLVLVLIFLLSSSLVNAQQTEEEKVTKAYDWLNKEVSAKWDLLNTKQNVFSLLALQCNETALEDGNESLYKKSVYSQGKRCWGTDKVTSQGQCKLTESALGKITFEEFGYNTTDIASWLISRNKTFLDIHWYLQIDIEQGEKANCSIIYQGVEEEGFRVYRDKSVAILGSSRCFSAADYWFKVKQNEECYNNQYTVKCWSGSSYYIVSWLYKRSPTSNIFYVSEETQSARPGYGTVEPDPIDTKLTSYCLSNPSDSMNCDYEGTGWAAYALAKQGNTQDANVYIPYLVVAQDSNVKYFPSTFLYQLMGTSLYETKIKMEQKSAGYWLIQPIVYGRNYDTAHAAMALGLGDEDVDRAKTWLLSTQTNTGYWDSGDPGREKIRDTAFILWVFWPDLCDSGGGIINITNVTTEDCEDQGPEYTCRDTCESDEIIIPFFNCTGTELCCKQIGGYGGDECINEGGMCRDDCYGDEFELTIDCPGTDVCCKPYIDLTCDEIEGEFCTGGMMCEGEEVETSDSLLYDCCLGTCVTGQTCDVQGGETCEPPQYCPAGREITASDTNYCCEQGYCQSAGSLDCEMDLYGELCMAGEVCVDYYGSQKNFVTTQDGNCCVDGDCVEDIYCSSIGQECLYPKQCYQNTHVRTLDVDECCTSECLAYCTDEGGVYCDAEQDCEGGYFIESIEGSSCCLQGTCKSKGAGFPWWIFIIIIIIAGGAAAYFLYFKKPRKPKIKPGFPFPRPGIGPRPGMRPMRPGIRPGLRPGMRPMIMAPQKGKGPGMPLKKPGIVMPSTPRPTEKMPSGAPAHIMKKMGKPSPTITRMAAKPQEKPRTRAKAKAAKTKTEAELEKTLKKLKTITKTKPKAKAKKKKKVKTKAK